MEDVKINRKILGECCREVLFKAAVGSKSLRENVSFIEQFKVCKKVSEMSDIEAICMVFNEGKLLEAKQSIKGIEDKKIRTALKYGLAATAGGLAAAAKVPIGKHAILKTLGSAALGALLLYMVRTATDPCARECIKKYAMNAKKRTVCKRECEIKAIKKIVAQINSQKSQCRGTANPGKCEKKLNAQLIKWKKKLQTKIIELSKAKEKLAISQKP